ncbi:MAG: pyruvoyl-dependent arginine decarboxylase [bacterium]
MLSSLPNLVILAAGAAEGGSRLNAFDNALLKAGIANWNLVRVSSILPPKAEITYEIPFIEKGSLVPIVLAEITSDKKGDIISAAVAIGVGNEFGVIMEHSGRMEKEGVEEEVKRRVEEAFAMRNLDLRGLHIISSQHKVEKLGCAIAAAILWWR